jgi:hypothetical protein
MADDKKEKSRLDKALDDFKYGHSVKGRKEIRDAEAAISHAIHQGALSYLSKIHGKTDEGAPKKFDIEGPDQAHEMVLEMAKAVVQHKYKGMDKKGLEHITKNEHLLMEEMDHALEAVGERGGAHGLIGHFADHGDNVTSSDKYTSIRDGTAKHIANAKHQHAANYLVTSTQHREKIENIVNDELAKQGHKEKVLRKGLAQHNVVQHLGAAYAKSLSPDYVEGKDRYANHFAKKKDK